MKTRKLFIFSLLRFLFSPQFFDRELAERSFYVKEWYYLLQNKQYSMNYLLKKIKEVKRTARSAQPESRKSRAPKNKNSMPQTKLKTKSKTWYTEKNCQNYILEVIQSAIGKNVI